MSGTLRFAALGSAFVLATLSAHAQHGGADRVVAERVLRLGGVVILEGSRRPILDLHDLPDTDFRLHTLDLVGVSMGAWGLKDELSRLPAIPHLKELYINGRLWYNQPVSLVADTIGLFASAASLEKLVLSKPVQTYIPLEDSVLAKLAALPAIEELRLHQTRLPGSTLAPFSKLKYLDLSHNRFFDDRGLVHVGRMTGLEKLYLTGTSITDEGLRHLAGLRHLTELELYGTENLGRGARAPGRPDHAAASESPGLERHRRRARTSRADDQSRGADALSHEDLECRPRAPGASQATARSRRSLQPRHGVGCQRAPHSCPCGEDTLRRCVESYVETDGRSGNAQWEG